MEVLSSERVDEYYKAMNVKIQSIMRKDTCRGLDQDAGMLQGRIGTLPAPIHSGHCHHDGRAGRDLPTHPTAGTASTSGSTDFPDGRLHPRGPGDFLGGAQYLPELLGRPVGNASVTPPPVVD